MAVNVTSRGKKRFSAQCRQSFPPRALAIAIALRHVLAYTRFRNFALFTVRIFAARQEINVARMQTRKTDIEGGRKWARRRRRRWRQRAIRSLCAHAQCAPDR